MAIRRLTDAELRQRREAAKHGGRPRKDHGTRAARRAVAAARELGEKAQAEAARNLIYGMRGLLPTETAPQIIACSREVLTRWGNPPRFDVKEVDPKSPVGIYFGLEGADFPKGNGAATNGKDDQDDRPDPH